MRNPDLAGRCSNCGREVVRLKRTTRPVCTTCQNIAKNRRQAGYRRRRSGLITKRAARYLEAGAGDRKVADLSLNTGQCCRRCECGQLYHLDTLETPCPNCHHHLFDNPLEARHVRAA